MGDPSGRPFFFLEDFSLLAGKEILIKQFRFSKDVATRRAASF